MCILNEINKVKSNLSCDISPDLFINSLNMNFLTGKAVETLVENGTKTNGLEEFESILNAVYFLIAELEENHGHEKQLWLNSPIIQYVQSLQVENKFNTQDPIDAVK